MSVEHAEAIHHQLVKGKRVPGNSELQNSEEHLLISMSELILDSVFYHPAVKGHINELSATDKQALDAILGGQTISLHFVSALVATIEAAITGQTRTIRVLLSDADSQTYRQLLGGWCEEEEFNPAMGCRGVSRFAGDFYHQAFALECEVVKQLRAKGHDIEIVVPFVRTLSDAATIIDRLAEQGLPRGLAGLKVLYSCDVPSAALLAERLLPYFDGALINLDLLTQFVVGADSQNASVSAYFNPEGESVLMLMESVYKAAAPAGKPMLVAIHELGSYPKLQAFLAEIIKPEAVFCY